MLVNFLIAGTQKGGTSALDAYLREHPQICMADKKEVHFFDNEKYFSSLKPNYDKYHSAFTPNALHKVIGEATPIYMYWDDAPKRIWEYNPDMKIILSLRNPVERAYSHWNMEVSRNQENLSFMDAINQEASRATEALPYQHRVYSYVDRGFYSHQLRRLWRYFPKENTLILRQEDLRLNPNETLRKVSEFLGLNDFPFVRAKKIHEIQYKNEISKLEKKMLINIFKNEILEIERLLGWDCKDWSEL
ncbi:sulfotransferase domain-containing protein [Marinobacter mobilis]|uniref:Sulfotransferase domain-containing protein n=1 Tax=Marinobacter mobilis TaxID=488533 RepID=A0A1H3DDE0_9GAMM|nr:sulfotransferase domain-containing protein [Marinobacter mobilis]SDX63699.1 Sulfotransferase domain-containing protein [Marinobacter mobilis]